jgi:hypothetical protein
MIKLPGVFSQKTSAVRAALARLRHYTWQSVPEKAAPTVDDCPVCLHLGNGLLTVDMLSALLGANVGTIDRYLPGRV